MRYVVRVAVLIAGIALLFGVANFRQLAQSVGTSLDSPVPDPAGPFTVRLGQSVTVTCSAGPCATVTVKRLLEAAIFKDPAGVFDDTAPAGQTFLAAEVEYTSLADGLTYQMFDWSAYADDRVAKWTTAAHGPGEDLSAGQLPRGKSVGGWIYFTVPVGARSVVLAFAPGGHVIFQVVL